MHTRKFKSNLNNFNGRIFFKYSMKCNVGRGDNSYFNLSKVILMNNTIYIEHP